MARAIYIFLLFSFFSSLIAQEEQWLLKRQEGHFRLWLHKDNYLVTGTLERSKKNTKVHAPNFNDNTFLKHIEASKRKTLKFIGISQWKVHHHKWHPQKKILLFEGSYLNSDNKKVNFMEWHHFKDDETIQILHTHPHDIKHGKQYQNDFLTFVQKNMEKP